MIHDCVTVRSDDIETGGLDQPEFRNAVIILRQRFDVSGAVFLGEEVAADGRDIGQAFCPAQTDRCAFRCVRESDSADIDLLKILL